MLRAAVRPDTLHVMSDKIVVCQKWEESERGWGVRPDGYSLHPSEEARERYIQAYWDRMPADPPDEYERPSGSPYFCRVDEEDYQELFEEGRDGLRFYSNDWPEGGTDGWLKPEEQK